jgi:hypothetical protein
MHLPRPRGPLSQAVVDRLRTGPEATLPEQVQAPDQPLSDSDFQLALWVLYELSYRGFDDLADGEDAEWAPDVLAFRALLEEVFEAELRALVEPRTPDSSEDIVEAILEICEGDEDARSMASYLQRDATVEQFTEYLVAKSVYHLKESDPQSFVIPRLSPAVKAALVELQYDEYGDGRPERVHQAIFARALESVDLDATYGAYVDRAPGPVLAENNAMSLFALHRRLRGASMGHLAAFESTSSVPCRFVAMGIRRLELPEEVAAYYDEHVEADSIHEQVALRDICARLVAEEPGLADGVLLGATACIVLEERATAAILDAWESGASGLLPDPVGEAA